VVKPIDPLQVAEGLAEELLFPTALATDAGDRVPREHLDHIAEAGLYGLFGPAEAGGMAVEESVGRRVMEIMASGCLTTTFVWMPHHGAVRSVAASSTPGLREKWLAPMCRGDARAGFALGGILPGGPGVTARPVDGGWLLTGTAPWVTGWHLVDVVHTAAHAPDDTILWSLIDAVESPTLTCERLRLLAVNASVTVSVHFHDHFVPAERVTGTEPLSAWVGSAPSGNRLAPVGQDGRWSLGRHHMATVTGALALGLTSRCCRLMPPGPLDGELLTHRNALDLAATSAPDTLPTVRAHASELALRAAAALVVTTGSRSILLSTHPQRLMREATFLLVFGTRPPIPSELLRLFVPGTHANGP
jgi:alkylation response protein AidB-like acyl-CoA dehydrogenase